MKIKNVSCEQFAGIRDRNVSFTDGINVVYGKNESGKSNVLEGISKIRFLPLSFFPIMAVTFGSIIISSSL